MSLVRTVGDRDVERPTSRRVERLGHITKSATIRLLTAKIPHQTGRLPAWRLRKVVRVTKQREARSIAEALNNLPPPLYVSDASCIVLLSTRHPPREYRVTLVYSAHRQMTLIADTCPRSLSIEGKPYNQNGKVLSRLLNVLSALVKSA